MWHLLKVIFFILGLQSSFPNFCLPFLYTSHRFSHSRSLFLWLLVVMQTSNMDSISVRSSLLYIISVETFCVNYTFCQYSISSVCLEVGRFRKYDHLFLIHLLLLSRCPCAFLQNTFKICNFLLFLSHLFTGICVAIFVLATVFTNKVSMLW